MQAEYPPNTPWQHAQQQPIMPPQPPAPQPGVVWLSPVANDRANLRWTGSALLLWALLLGFMRISSYPQITFSSLAGWGVILFDIITLPGLIFIFGIIAFIQARRWNVINQRRKQAAAYGFVSGVPLAEPQPFPNIEALPLPFTIKLKTNWFSSFLLFCLTIGLYWFLEITDVQAKIAHWLYYWPFFLVFVPIGFACLNPLR